MLDPISQSAVRLISNFLPNRSIDSVELLSGGLINTNVKVSFLNHKPVVVRLHRDGSKSCRKELAIHHLAHVTVPLAKIIHSEPDGLEDLPPFSILEFVSGITFQQLKRTENVPAINQAAYSVGETLARIGQFRFSNPGELLVKDGSLKVGSRFIDGPNPIPHLLDGFLSAPVCQQRLNSKLVDLVHNFGWAHCDLVPSLDENPRLVHCDFGNRNIIVHETGKGWQVAAVLDWELSISGSQLLDVGHFLRYEQFDQPLREPYFSRGFIENGGDLPSNWKQIVRVIDLTGLVECLTHESLPTEVTSELITLIEATISMQV